MIVIQGFVIRRIADGKFVRHGRSGFVPEAYIDNESYTDKLQEARVYDNRTQAEEEVCKESELIVSLSSILGRNISEE